MVAHAAALKRRRLTGAGQQVGQAAAGPECGDVVGGPIGIRPALAVAGDQPVHQPRVVVGQRLVVEPKAAQRAGPDVGDENVCATD